MERPKLNGLKIYTDPLTREKLEARLKRDKWDTATIRRVYVKHKGTRGDYYYYVSQWAAQAPYGYWYTFTEGTGRGGTSVVLKHGGDNQEQWDKRISDGRIVFI